MQLLNIVLWNLKIRFAFIDRFAFMLQMFDRELCCRQLRYSGMMETIRYIIYNNAYLKWQFSMSFLHKIRKL